MRLVAPVHKHAKQIVRAAVAEATTAIVGSAQVGPPSPPAQITATDSAHPFIMGLDKAGDPTALPTSKRGL